MLPAWLYEKMDPLRCVNSWGYFYKEQDFAFSSVIKHQTPSWKLSIFFTANLGMFELPSPQDCEKINPHLYKSPSYKVLYSST